MKIDIRDVPFYYLNTSARSDRCTNVEQQLTGFRYERVSGDRTGNVPADADRSVLCPLGHARVINRAVRHMRGAFEPFILLEDDCSWRSPPHASRLKFDVPADADAVHIGVSNCGVLPDRDDFCMTVLRDQVATHPHLQRVYNMLSAHAVLFLSFRYCLAYAQAMVESCAAYSCCDCVSSRLMPQYNVLALAQPLFFQDSRVGGVEQTTNIVWEDARAGFTGDSASSAKTYHQQHPYCVLAGEER